MNLIKSFLLTIIISISPAILGSVNSNHPYYTPYPQSSYIHKYANFKAPEDWARYTFYDGSLSLSVPPTVELRTKNDKYQDYTHGTDGVIIFQQKYLSNMAKEGLDRYCRVMIQYVKGEKGDFLKYYESEEIDYELRCFFRELVVQEVSSLYDLIGEPSYRWVNVNGYNAVEIKWRRSGSNNYTTSCKMYLLFNDDEMSKIIISYRDQEKNIWLPDFDNIIKTFNWVN